MTEQRLIAQRNRQDIIIAQRLAKIQEYQEIESDQARRRAEIQALKLEFDGVQDEINKILYVPSKIATQCECGTMGYRLDASSGEYVYHNCSAKPTVTTATTTAAYTGLKTLKRKMIFSPPLVTTAVVIENDDGDDDDDSTWTPRRNKANGNGGSLSD